jgi:hypothetical protein
MSLAMYAAPFDEVSMINNDKEDYYKKKQVHNKTQKKYPREEINHDKVNSVLQSIHQQPKSEEDDDDPLGDFYPPPKPQSSGVQKTISTEQMMNRGNKALNKSLGLQAVPTYEDQNEDLELNDYSVNYGDKQANEEYYKKYIPNYTGAHQKVKMNDRTYAYNLKKENFTNPSTIEYGENDLLLQKINYMINLLEEKQDERTNNVTEEIILYSFLGIFIIFIVDSFTRVGKYVR